MDPAFRSFSGGGCSSAYGNPEDASLSLAQTCRCESITLVHVEDVMAAIEYGRYRSNRNVRSLVQHRTIVQDVRCTCGSTCSVPSSVLLLLYVWRCSSDRDETKPSVCASFPSLGRSGK